MTDSNGNFAENQPTNGSGSRSSNQPMLNQLLAVATEAQGDRPTDPAVAVQLSAEDRAWLENALQQIGADSDPVKKLRRWMNRLEEFEQPTAQNLADMEDILEEIGDLVCDMDLAQVFCSLGGLQLVQRFLDKEFEPCNALFVHLIGVLAQYNPKVQQLLVNQQFLQRCLEPLGDPSKSANYRHKCVGAVSAIVKGHLPSLIRFIQLDGVAKMMRCFESGMAEEEHKLAHRCVVAAVALKNSFSVEVLNADSNFRKVGEMSDQMRRQIEARNAERQDGLYKESLEFLRC